MCGKIVFRDDEKDMSEWLFAAAWWGAPIVVMATVYTSVIVLVRALAGRRLTGEKE